MELSASVNFVKTHAINNSMEINSVKVLNNELSKENELLKQENLAIKASMNTYEEKLEDHENHLNSIEQYLCVNNLEIVGLPEAEPEGTPIEEELLKIFNSLPDLPNPLTSDDIDICHILPNKKGQKIVAVCKFVCRKSKFDILNARKNCRDFKYKENLIYINDHLSPYFRNLFALASQKKKSLGFTSGLKITNINARK